MHREVLSYSLSLFRNIDVCHLIQPELRAPGSFFLAWVGVGCRSLYGMHLTVSGALVCRLMADRLRCSWNRVRIGLVGGRRRPHVHAEKALVDLGHEPNTSPPPKWPKKWPRARPH